MILGLYFYNLIFRVGDIFTPHTKNAANRAALLQVATALTMRWSSYEGQVWQTGSALKENVV